MQLHLVNSVHEHFTAEGSHLHASHHQASLKHEYFPVLQYTTAAVHCCYHKTVYTGALSTMSIETFTVESQLHYLKKINLQLLLGITTRESIKATNFTLKTPKHEINLKHENFAVSNHIIYNYILVAIAQKHFIASTNYLMFTKIELSWNGVLVEKLNDRNFKNISNSTHIWIRLFYFAHIWFRLLKFTQMLIIYSNMNGALLSYPDVSNSTQIWMKLFQLPKFDWRCWNSPKHF